MQQRFSTRIKLDYIQDFEMMLRSMDLERAREASTYYTILVMENPREFSDFLRISEDLVGISRRPLEAGRKSLLESGLIAKVLFSEPVENFGRERYLPVNPRIIWEETKEEIKPMVSEEAFEAMESNMEEITRAYHENFKTHGIKLSRKGKVTLRYSGKWIYYALLSNCYRRSSHLRLQLSGEELSEKGLVACIRRLLELNEKIRLLMDGEENLDNIKKLKDEFGKRLEVRLFPGETLMKSCVFGKEFAIASMKILSEDPVPFYVGTAYVDMNEVEKLSKEFDGMWELSRPV